MSTAVNATASPSPSPFAPAAASTPGGTSHRIDSLDIVRGIVMVLMAIDHVRVYSGLPAGGPTAGIFFTRWVTHFVAPAFAFLAGTAAYLYGQRVRDTGKLARFLATRGLWLVLLELTVLRFAWTFNFDYAHYMLAGVIWMLGWCMVLMAGLVYLPVAAIATFGLVMVFGHNVMNYVTPHIMPALVKSAWAWLAQILYYGGPIQLPGGSTLMVLFVIVPWVGVMATGYAFGRVMQMPVAERRRISLRIGWAAIALFLVLRGVDRYGDPNHWRPHPRPGAAAVAQQAPPTLPPGVVIQRPPALLRFLGTSKYPASLIFLLMTLGPMFLALAYSENWHGRVADALRTFGRVPFFFYALHIPLIHLMAVLVSLVRTPAMTGWLFTNHPMMNPDPPDGYTWNLGMLYVAWAVAIVVLYYACRWFAGVKARNRGTWLSYL